MNDKSKYPAIAAKFKAIADEVSTEDVMRTALEMGCHYETVKRYLSGKVLQEAYGKRMLKILEATISERENAEL